MRCAACHFEFQGIARQCPRCEAPLPGPAAIPSTPSSFTPAPPGDGWSPRRSRAGFLAAVVAGILVLTAILVGFVVYANSQVVCDLRPMQPADAPGPAAECADSIDRSELIIFALGLPTGLAAGTLVTMYMIRRTNPRRPIRAGP